MAEFDYDLFVIGAGSGGVRAARIAANHGAKVAIAEEYRVGGTCVIRGCVPKKLLVYAGRFADSFKEAEGFGWSVPEPRFDWPTLIANKDHEIDRLEGAYSANLEKSGVEIFKTRAELKDRHTVHLVAENRQVTAGRILIATGGHPNTDEKLEGREHTINSNEAFHLETLPRSILIAGGGYIAVEFASIFNKLGVDTTLIYRGQRVLRGFDEDLRVMLEQEMQGDGVRFVYEDVFTKIEKTEEGLIGHTRCGEKLVADQIMFAIGRDPNTRGLGLENAGVKLNEKGAVEVDAYSRTSVDNIFAVGDVTDRLALTPAAIREGHAFAESEFNANPTRVDHKDVATAVFSTPEIGTIGLTEEEACATLDQVDVYRAAFRPMKLSLTPSDKRMLVKVIVDGATDRVVGCHVLGPDAGEIIQAVAIAVKMGATKADFDATMAVHPTAAEELVTLREPTTRHIRQAAE